MRVYEVAKELQVTSAKVIELLQRNGVAVASHMAVLRDADIALLKKELHAKVVMVDVVDKKKVSQNKVKLSSKLDTGKSKQQPILEERFNITTGSDGEDLLKDVSKKVSENVLGLESDKISLIEEDVPLIKKSISDIPDFYSRSSSGSVDEDVDYSVDSERGLPINLSRIAKVSAWMGDSAGAKRRKRKKQKGLGARDKSEGLVSGNVKASFIDLSKPYSVIELAKDLNWSPMQMVGFFIKKGKFYSLNDLIPTSDLELFAPEWDIDVVNHGVTRNVSLSLENNLGDVSILEEAIKGQVKRPPVVVIMGHVDHGKTSLIDYMRKTNIAAKEKGGITQTVKVYPVSSSSGDFIIIDTPGHKAFSLMRQVGAKITDIAVIIIAADDGVMAQTIESIKIAKNMGAVIVIAINKIDKEGVSGNIDKIKQQLAQHDVLVEDWGGSVVCVSISAKTGAGVDGLLEIINLQAELMDLKTTEQLPAKAFIVESFIEKGLGSCAAVLLKQGILRVGDNFVVAGHAVGRVKAIIGISGKYLKVLHPYQPAKIVGLSEVAKTGEFLEFVATVDLERAKNLAKDIVSTAIHSGVVEKSSDLALNVLLKADGYGTMDALVNAIDIVLSKDAKFRSMVNIVSSSVGNIYEKDVLTAIENNATILGMNIILEKNASELVRANKVVVKIESIIYRLTEWLEEAIIAKLKSIKELKLLGKGFVKKVFDMKNKGVIAGCQVTEGSFAEKTVMHCIRNGVKVGEGKVSSLQQNKKTVKEVAAGFDCGFISQGFSGWLENDKVVCYQEISIY